mgnify:CR=1 FL=1
MKAKVITSIPGPKSKKLLAYNKEHNGGWSVPHPFVHSGQGEGCYFKDADGNTFLDFASQVSSLPLGYNHPALQAVLKKYKTTPIKYAGQDFLVKEHNELLEELFTITPSGMNAAFLINSGAEAVENAIKICMRKQHHAKVCISFKNAFHGRTLGALSLTNTAKHQQKEDYLAIPTERLPFTDEAPEVLDHLLTKHKPEEIACVIMEPIQGEGGYNVPSSKMVQKIRAMTKQMNIPFIADEVQSGMGRTGEWWCMQHYNVKPDVMAAAKALQVGATIANKEMFPTQPGSISSTWGGGHVLDLAIGIEIIRVIKKKNLLLNVKKQGKYLMQCLRELARENVNVRNVRGVGLMTAFDLPTGKMRNDLVIEAVKRGLVVIGCGMQGIRLIPPYIITKKEIDEAMDIIRASLKACSSPLFQQKGPVCDFMECGESHT